jgi:hypothetical protein
MIVSELQLLEVIREPLRGDSVVFHDAFLGVTPEPLQAVDVHPATREVFPVVHTKVSVAAEHERVVAPIFVCVDDAPPTNFLDRESQHIFCPGAGKHFHEDSSLPLQNAENRDFAGGTPSPFPFSLSSKIRFVHFDFAAKGHVAIDGMSQDGGTDRVDGFIRGIVGEAELLSDLPDGEFQFEEFDEAQPVSGGKISLVDPAAGEIMEGVAA